MAPSTRAVHRETTPSTHIEARERDTVQKTRFYKEYDLRCSSESLRAIAKSLEVPESSARLLLRQRALLGNKAYRKLRPQSQNLGRKQTVPPETLQMLISEENPVRNQPYDRQIEFHQISIKPRSLQLRLTEHINKAQRYKQAYIAKEISVANLQHRVNYGEKYQYETIDSFWQFVFFTDEAHFDPSSQGVSRILREQGTRYNPENIQQRPELESVKLHVAGWVNWHAKCERLEFYNDEEEYEFRPSTRGRPRRSKYEPEEAYSQRVLEWEAERPHTRVVKPKGNAMTQKYYTERLLPRYVTALQQARLNGPSSPSGTPDWILQEDGDPSHGHRKEGLASAARAASWVPILEHPPQSPDLNPQEGC